MFYVLGCTYSMQCIDICLFTCVAEGESRSRSAVTPSVCPKILSSQLLWNYWSNYHVTWYVDGTSYAVMHIGRKFWSPYFCGSYAPWNLENTHKWPCHWDSSETTDPFISWNLVYRKNIIWCYAYWQEILIPSFLWALCPLNFENIRKSTNNLSFLWQFFINKITASDAGPDIIRSHLLYLYVKGCWALGIYENISALWSKNLNNLHDI